MASLTPSGFLSRWLIAVALVLGTFNPTQYCYLYWVLVEPDQDLPLKFLVGAVLVIGYFMFFRATFESIGWTGIILAIIFFSGVVWTLMDIGLLDPSEPQIFVWIILFILATIMAIGVSWSILRRKITGQVDQV